MSPPGDTSGDIMPAEEPMSHRNAINQAPASAWNPISQWSP